MVVHDVQVVKRILDEAGSWAVRRDPVLQLPVYKRLETQSIFGLPAVGSDMLYLVPAPREPDWQEDEGEYLLKCDWGVAYL